MSVAIEKVVCRSTAVRQVASREEQAGDSLTQPMVDALELLCSRGYDAAEVVALVRLAHLWYGPGAEADHAIDAQLSDLA